MGQRRLALGHNGQVQHVYHIAISAHFGQNGYFGTQDYATYVTVVCHFGTTSFGRFGRAASFFVSRGDHAVIKQR